MTDKIILTTVVDEDVSINLHLSIQPRVKVSSSWAKLNIENNIQMPINHALDMNVDGFILHQMGTVGGPDWWSGFNSTSYADGRKHLNVVEMLPSKLMKKIRNKTAMVHYDQSLEGFPMITKDRNYYELFYKYFKIFGLPPEQFIYTTANLLEEEIHNKYCIECNIPEENRMVVIASNFFATSTADPTFFGSESDFITVAEHIQYKEANNITLYNCLNRVIREHRVALSAMLNYYNLIDGYKISQNVYPKHFSKSILMNQFKDHPAFKTENVTDIYNKLPLVLDTNEFHINKAQHFFKDLYLETYINVITETFYSEYHGYSMFFSEKIYKPMRARQPFILVGAPGSIKALQAEGFKTFDKWFDESYSDIKDDTDRLEAICKLLLELNKKTKNEWLTMYAEMEEVLNHNYNILMTSNWLQKFRNILHKRITNEL
jgi:hypothetical protein